MTGKGEGVHQIDTDRPLGLVGHFGSPYSMKMRAVLRYRRIPFRWMIRDSAADRGIPKPPVAIIPVIAFPGSDGTYVESMVDSSPQIDRLETMYAGRSLTHPDPGRHFLDLLIEDYADEWITKCMYHYRWFDEYPGAIDKAGSLLPLATNLRLAGETLERAKAHIIRRQTGRTPLVGSTVGNQPVIESSYRRLLAILEESIIERDFLFGSRPARADFGLFGQLIQLIRWEPDSMEIAVKDAPHVYSWIDKIDDLSGLEVSDDDWDSGDLPSALDRLLREIGRTYAPFLIANAQASAASASEVVCEIDGIEYRQSPFPYQVKCLQWLREAYGGLGPAARADVDQALNGTGAEQLFA